VGVGGDVEVGVGVGWYRPGTGTTWQLQLQGTVETAYEVDLYDIDLFDVPKATIAALQARGKHVICYFSAGSFENYRDDAGTFAEEDLGTTLDGWPDERWLDVRSEGVRTVMRARLDVAVAKGCDGVDPDNVDGYTQDSGFPLTADEQLDFNRFLAREAHARGLTVGLKNDLDQIPALVADFDFALNEQCHAYDECALLAPFVTAGKPAFVVEYDARWVDDADARNTLCEGSRADGLRTLVLPLLLDDSFRWSCEP